MKKYFFPVLLVFLIPALSATAAFALDGACNPQVWDMQKTQSDAMRVRDQAYTQQVITQPDSTLAVTCFDQSLALTSELGSFFSDNVITAPPAASGSGGLSSLLGGLMSGGISGLLNAAVTLMNTTVTSAIGNLTNPANQTTRTTLGADLKLVIAPTLTVELQNFVDALSAFFGGLLDSFTSALFSGVLNYFSSLLGLPSTAVSSPYTPTCTKMQTLWNNNNSASGGPHSLEGSGVDLGAPYTSLQSLFSGNPPGAGTDFLGTLTNATNSPILSTALTNLTTLNAPGGISSWPTSPVLPVGSTTASIISGM